MIIHCNDILLVWKLTQSKYRIAYILFVYHILCSKISKITFAICVINLDFLGITSTNFHCRGSICETQKLLSYLFHVFNIDLYQSWHNIIILHALSHLFDSFMSLISNSCPYNNDILKYVYVMLKCSCMSDSNRSSLFCQ